MTGNETITGKIIGIRDCGSLVLVFLGTDEGQVVPVSFDHRPFHWLLEGEQCSSVELIGRSVTFDGETLTFEAEAKIMMTNPTIKFPLGQVAATPGALQAMEDSGQEPGFFLDQHSQGEWGLVSEEDWRLNDEALIQGDRLLSVYRTLKGVKLYAITEADRSVTTVLLPSEY